MKTEQEKERQIYHKGHYIDANESLSRFEGKVKVKEKEKGVNTMINEIMFVVGVIIGIACGLREAEYYFIGWGIAFAGVKVVSWLG